MIVVTLLVSSRQQRSVKQARLRPHCVVATSTIHETLTILRTQPSDVLVVDPVIGRVVPRVAASADELYSVAVEFPYLPVVFYVSNPANALRLIARFPTRERCDALVVGLGDDSQSIGAALESVVASSQISILLRDLGLAGGDVPSALQRAVRQVFSTPRAFHTVHDFAGAACMSRRTLDRWLARRGLVSGADMLQVARAFLAVRLERDRLVARDEIYNACGVAGSQRVDTFIEHATGYAAELLIESSDAEVAASIRDRLQRRRAFS